MSQNKKIRPPLIVEKDQTKGSEEKSFFHSKWFSLLFFVFAFVLYGNTLGHEYTQDDAIVIYDNMYTTQGFSGIPGLLTKDTFYGFFKEAGKQNLVAGGRYRPLTPVMFAIEYQFFGKNPFWGHLLNVIWYGILGIVLYKTLSLLFLNTSAFKGADNKNKNTILVALTTALFLAHPIHTEAVANIKGRDEIISMLGSVAALYFLLKQLNSGQKKFGYYAALSFFGALMSKENAITYLAVIPMALVFFRNQKLGAALKLSLPLLFSTLVFIIIRTSILGFDTGGTPNELMNNPYIKVVGDQYIPFSLNEKMATILFTLGKYLQLLVVPYQLTHDYYPRHIDIMYFGDFKVLLSILAYMLLIYTAFHYRSKNKLITFSILYFLFTLSIVSNIVFPIGTNMSERFMFMPSLGYALLLSYVLLYISGKKNSVLVALSSIILMLYSVKTFSRNFVWKNDFTLFTTDVKTSVNSAKVLNAAGGALVTESANEKDSAKKANMLSQAETYLNKAILIHPNYKNAWLLLGNDYFYQNKKLEAQKAYETALKIDPNFKDAKVNLAVALRDLGRYYGEKENNLVKSEQTLLQSLSLNSSDTETLRLLGISYGLQNKHEDAINVFKKIVNLEPKSAGAYVNLSNAYKYAGKLEESKEMMMKALEIDPNAFKQQ